MGEMLPRLDPSWVGANRDELVVQLDRAIECMNGRETETKQQAHIRQLADAKGRAEATLQFLERYDSASLILDRIQLELANPFCWPASQNSGRPCWTIVMKYSLRLLCISLEVS